MASKLSKTYRVQDGCWNCGFVACVSDYEEQDEYYCNRNNDKIEFEDIDLDENGNTVSDEEFDRRHRMFTDWWNSYFVSSYGYCNQWKRQTLK